jgi:putative transposase
LDDARAKIEAWRVGYNETRPHGALEWNTPTEYARRCLLGLATAGLKKPENSICEQF